VADSYERNNEPSGFIRGGGISCLAEGILNSQEGLCSI
jgi:hypothetical protein